jgi:acyl-CoA thioester hydrolase
MAYADFAFFHRLRVRWAEVDPVGVVFNAHYPAYIHVAFDEYCRALGLPNAMTQHQAKRVLFVRKSTLEFFASARFDDELEIGFRCAHLGRSSLRFVQEIYLGQKMLISGELTYVYTDTEIGKGVALPEQWRQAIQSFEKNPP